MFHKMKAGFVVFIFEASNKSTKDFQADEPEYPQAGTVHGDAVPGNDLLAHALSNAANPRNPYKIQRGNALVNEYARIDENTQERTDGGASNPTTFSDHFQRYFHTAWGDLKYTARRMYRTKRRHGGHSSTVTEGYAFCMLGWRNT